MRLEYPKYRRLRIPTNWSVRRMDFYDISPDADEKFKTNPEDDGWTIFNQYLLSVEYKDDRRWTLEVSWHPKFSAQGRYILSLSDEAWINKSPKYDEMSAEEIISEEENSIKLETRSLNEITTAVNDLMLKISLENGDYPNHPQDLQLQEFIPDYYIRYVKNEFFDLEPNKNLTTEQWQLFQEKMLIVEHYKDSDWQITAGWFPAFDPNGQYKIKVSLEKLDKEIVEIFETKSKAEAVNYLDNVFSQHLKKLYEKYEKEKKSGKRAFETSQIKSIKRKQTLKKRQSKKGFAFVI